MSLGNRYARWMVDREKVLVTRGWAANRRLMLTVLLRMAIVLPTVAIVGFLDSGGMRALAMGVLGGIGGSWAGKELVRASAYRSGWLEGRRDMIEKIHQSKSATDWVQTVMLYDSVHVLGMELEAPDSLEGWDDIGD